MSSIITAVLKATVGLLVNKGRDVAAEKLKEGDVTDQKFRALIVREMQDIKTKLDALSRKDLGAAIDFFETGLEYLYEAIHTERGDSARAEATERTKEKKFNVLSTRPTDTVMTVALAARIRNMQLTELDETTKSVLFQAKERFKMAREKATETHNNEALSTFDRVTAIRYRIMATMLESPAELLGTASDLSSQFVKLSTMKSALPECKQCLQKLHSLPAVQNIFKVELEKGLFKIKGRFGKDERREIISTVCQVNRAIYDVTQTVGQSVHVWTWPCVDTGGDKVDPLRDGRVTKVLRKVGMEHCCVPWSFGQEGEEKHKLKRPVGITTNTHGQFIIADDEDKTLKVFDNNGYFLLSFNPQICGTDTKLDILDVATDVEDNTYTLVRLRKPGASICEQEVQVFNDTTGLLHKFPVRRGAWGRLTVSGSKVLALSYKRVDVNEQNGQFVCNIGLGELKCATDITAANDGRVMVMDHCDSSVHLFTVEGEQLYKFNINTDHYFYIACHPAGEHVFVAGAERETGQLRVAIYTTSGEFVRRIQLDEEEVRWISGITVTMEGHIALIFGEMHDKKVIVV